MLVNGRPRRSSSCRRYGDPRRARAGASCPKSLFSRFSLTWNAAAAIMQCLLRPRWVERFLSGAESSVNQGPGSSRKVRFDALKLAAENEALSGVLDARSLDRVVDRLATNGAARIAWRIEGSHDALRRPELVVAIEGTLPLV